MLHGEERQQRENRDDRDVLKKEDSEGGLASGGLELAAFLKGGEHDRRGGHRDDEAGGERDAKIEAEEGAERSDGRGGADHLETAESQQLGAHPPKEGGLEFETDEEEHHDDTELGEVHNVFGALADEAERMGTDEDAGHQVAENGAEPEAFRDRDRDDGGDEVDEGLKEEGVHLAEGGQEAGVGSSVRFNGGGVGEADGAGDYKWREPFHPAEEGRLLEGREEFVDGEVVVAGASVSLCGATRGERGDERFAVEDVVPVAVGEAVFEHEIEPLFQEGGATIPVERMLEDDDVVGPQELLLMGDVDVKIGVGLVEIVKRDARHGPRGGGETNVDARFLEGGMSEKYEDAGGRGHAGKATGEPAGRKRAIRSRPLARDRS